MKNAIRHIKQKLLNLLNGYAWATRSRWKLALGFGLFAVLSWLIAWHTDQYIRDLGDLRSSYGIPYWIVFIIAGILLLHEADHKWTREWIKLPVGLLCVFFIHYCFLSLLWILFASIAWMPPWVSNYASVLILLLSCILTVIGFQNANKLKVTTYQIKLKALTEPTKIVLISDLHLGSFVRAKHVKRIVNRINERSPDMVIIAGDLIDDDHCILKNKRQQEKIARYFQRVQCKGGVVLTLGNHDANADDPQFQMLLEACRIRLLHNAVLEYPGFYLLGRSDPTRNSREPMEVLLSNCSRQKPVIVVDHDPKFISEAVAQGADLVLCGHTHAGQFFPASLLTKWAVGTKRFYGHHMEGTTHTVISSGAGVFNLPTRLGSCNEIVEIVLVTDFTSAS